MLSCLSVPCNQSTPVLLAALYRAALVSGLVSLCPLFRATAIEVQSSSAAEHERFEDDPSFIGAAYDWSGVGTDSSGRWVTLIDDRYFIAAEHHRPGGGDTVRFFHSNDPTGGFEDHIVDASFGTEIGGAGSDIWLGRLSSDVSSSVTSYDILDLGPSGSYANYEGLALFTVGIADGSGFANFRLGTNVINTASVGLRDTTGGGGVIDNWSYSFSYNLAAGSGESVVEIGDSGAPSFAVDGGVIKLVGIHSELGDLPPAGPSEGDRSFDSLVGAYATEIRSSAVPEPAGATLLLVAAGLGLLRRKKRCLLAA